MTFRKRQIYDTVRGSVAARGQRKREEEDVEHRGFAGQWN